MNEELKKKLRFLADKYETSSFYDEDPSQFLCHYKTQNETEVASFIASLLSFGSRKQFIPKIKMILKLADEKGGILLWLKDRDFKNDFHSESKNDDEKFYRFYSWNDLNILFEEIAFILDSNKSFGNAIKESYEKKLATKENFPIEERNFKNASLLASIQEFFPKSKIVPKGKTSANKRLHMFLRWMVRVSSPVDKGFWTWFSPSDLLIPLDTHVMQESEKLGLIPKKSSCSLKTSETLTDKLKEIWKDDPCKGDFALFGLGVSNDEKQF